jgi:hypothetical protein
VADEFADPGPRHSAEVEQRHAAVTEVVRAEVGDTSRGAGSCQRGSEAIAAEAADEGGQLNIGVFSFARG